VIFFIRFGFYKKIVIKLNFFKKTETGSNRLVSIRFFRTKTGSNWFGSVFLVWLCFLFGLGSVRFFQLFFFQFSWFNRFFCSPLITVIMEIFKNDVLQIYFIAIKNILSMRFHGMIFSSSYFTSYWFFLIFQNFHCFLKVFIFWVFLGFSFFFSSKS
jgi:hypothetical protein